MMSQHTIGPSDHFEITEMPNLDLVVSMIRAMYEQGEQKDYASKWLEALQKSIFAWQISDQLLIKQYDFQSCYFAAQTLKAKILKSFQELPSESYESLKNSIITHLVNLEGVKPIVTQLSLSIAYISYMNVNWQNPIEELSTKLSKDKFLEILICIAQEYDENRPIMKLSRPRRSEIEQYLTLRFPHVIYLLINCLNDSASLDPSQKEQLIQKVFTCFDSWIIFASKDHIELVGVILGTIINYLKNPECPCSIHEKAADALCKVIFQCEGHSQFAELRTNVIDHVFGLESAYQMALSVEDSSKLMDLARIFTELGNSMIDYLLHNQVDFKVIQLILNCVAHYEFEVAEVTFPFWYNLSEALYKNSRAQQFASYLNLLLSSLTRHCQLEGDSEGIVDDMSEQFEYRSQIKDLICEVTLTVNWIHYVTSSNVIETMKAASSWEVLEVHLYVIYCIASCEEHIIDESENQVLPNIVTFIISLASAPTQTHIQVYATACDMLGALGAWIAHNHSFLMPVTNFLLCLITTKNQNAPKLSSKAAVALKDILRKSKATLESNFVRNLFSSLAQIYSQIEDIRGDLSVSLLACCTAIVCNLAHDQEQEFFFQQMIQLCMAKIDRLMSEKMSAEEKRKRWETVIDNIYALFKNFEPNQRTLNSAVIHGLISEQVWPFLKRSLDHFAPLDSQVIEHCSRCVRHMVRSMKPAYLLQPIVDHIVPLYQHFPTNSPLVYIGSVLVDEFANKNDPLLCDGLTKMLQAFSISTFQFFSENPLHMYPFNLDDFFNLCNRMLVKLPDQVLAIPETLNNILNLAIAVLYLPQKEAFESITRFLVTFLSLNDHPVAKQYIMDEFGKKLLYSVIDTTTTHVPSYFIPDLADIVWCFKEREEERFKQTLHYSIEELFNKIQKDGHRVTKEDLENFYQTVLSANSEKRLVCELRQLQRQFS